MRMFLKEFDEPVIMRGGDILGECHDIVENLTNDQYFFGYSQACYPGAFDNYCGCEDSPYQPYDSIVEYLVTAEHGAFAFVANTRYGLGLWYSTNGPSQNFDREFSMP